MGNQSQPAHTAAETEMRELARWEITPDRSAIRFSIFEQSITTVTGCFRRFHGTLQFDPHRIELGAVEIEIEAASIDTGNEVRDRHLRSADFFDVAQYPAIDFRSRAIQPATENRFRVTGHLLLHGVRREVTLYAMFEGIRRDTDGSERACFTASTQINRTDFGMNWNVPLPFGRRLLDESVRIQLDIRAARVGS